LPVPVVNYEVIDRHIILIPAASPGKNQECRPTAAGYRYRKGDRPERGTAAGGYGSGERHHYRNHHQRRRELFPQQYPAGATLVFSFVGMRTQEVAVAGKTSINISMEEETIGIEEVVAIGYGTMRKSDLTGSVVRADLESFRQSPNISIIESLHGSVPGLSVGQVNSAGQEPSILIRGQSSLSGETAPLIVVDNVIFRGNLIDLNPNDIESVDVLKDASSTAIYGSQAANGVIIITTSKTGGMDGKPKFNYSGSYSFQSPAKELKPGTPEDFLKKIERSDIFFSRTAASGYLESNPSYSPVDRFKSVEEIRAFNDNRTIDWYDVLTNDNIRYQNHNFSVTNNTKSHNYLISLGFTEQVGYMLNDDYSRLNGRINFDNSITDWMKIGVQTFMSISDYSGENILANRRYLTPYATPYDENGEIIRLLTGNTSQINPLIVAESDNLEKRLNFSGNIYANIDIPFIKGLSYRLNFGNNYKTTSEYYYQAYGSNWTGQGSKREEMFYDMTLDNIITYQRLFDDRHNLNVTLLYGIEKRNSNSTRAVASNFITDILGYNRLQDGSADLQEVSSGAWKEASLYNMGRIFYGFKSKYLVTGTIRRDGFSGFSEENKFGVFPSLAFAWVLSEEKFVSNDWLDNLKLRISYGANGNRTIGRYQTLARVTGGFNYLTGPGTPIYTQSISTLASPNLKWETSTGVNLGVDFSLFRSIYGSIDYYNNNTIDLLYEVDIPGISRFEKFPDNLGKLHNQGMEFSITTVNFNKSNLRWTSTFNFSRNRNKLKELLGFDLNDDGKEDDLISEGLFIGKSIDAIYDYKVDGKWQINDAIPAGYDLGSNKVVDLFVDGQIDARDKTILGYRTPSYRFSIQNSLKYKDWNLTFFINSIQGGKNYYLAEDDLLGFSILNAEAHFLRNFPKGIDFWSPENPDARYQRPNIFVTSGIVGTTYTPRSFVRLQDISFGYNVSSSFIEKWKLHNLRVYLSGKNLITLTKWPGWDPETGEKITDSGLPVIKSYSIGMNIEF
jgi:TonB-dependent starch-binding outer membrane protein SusC